jgi:hypothetical protein
MTTNTFTAAHTDEQSEAYEAARRTVFQLTIDGKRLDWSAIRNMSRIVQEGAYAGFMQAQGLLSAASA